MKLGLYILSALLGVAVGFVPEARCSEIYWGETEIVPEFVVIGSLVKIAPAAHECPQEHKFGTDDVVAIFDCGTVAVDSVLWAAENVQEIPIIWQSAIRLDPLVEGRSVSSSESSKYELGERRIWIAFPKVGELKCPESDGYFIQALTLDWLEAVKEDVMALADRDSAHSN